MYILFGVTLWFRSDVNETTVNGPTFMVTTKQWQQCQISRPHTQVWQYKKSKTPAASVVLPRAKVNVYWSEGFPAWGNLLDKCLLLHNQQFENIQQHKYKLTLFSHKWPANTDWTSLSDNRGDVWLKGFIIKQQARVSQIKRATQEIWAQHSSFLIKTVI